MTKVGDALFIQVDPPVDAIVRVDTETGAATPFVKGGWKVVSGPEGLWVLCCDWLVKVDPDTGKELLRIEKGGSVALGDGAVWLLDQVGLHRIDPKKGTVGDPIGPGGALCAVDKGMAIAFGSAWLACKEGGVARLDIQTGKFVEIETPEGSHTLAVTDDAMWVTNYKSSSVSRIDPATNTATTIEGIGSGIGITAGGGFVWVSDPTGIAQLDPATGAIVGHIDLGPGLYYELVWDDGTIWASTRSDKIVKIDASQVSPPADGSGG
jgi:streptogramin lyase